MRAADIYRRTARTYWRRAGYLLVLGIAVFVPIGLLEALVDLAPEIHISSLGDLADVGKVALILGLMAQAFTSLLGDVFYSGAVGLALRRGEQSKPPSLGTVARHLSYGRLIAVDILIGAGTAVGLIALIVPGVVFFTWFALAGPIVELEGAGVRAAFLRSRRLVRGHFWSVLVVLVPIAVAGELLSTASLQIVHDAIHTPLIGDWVGEAVTNVLLSPIYAVAAVLITLELSDGQRERPPGAETAAVGLTTSDRP